MKFLNWLADKFLIAGLKLTSILYCIFVLPILVFVIFNIIPSYKNGKGNTTGLEFENGVPVELTIHGRNGNSDTMFSYKAKSKSKSNWNSSGFASSSDVFSMQLQKLQSSDSVIIQKDTIYTNSRIEYWGNHTKTEEMQLHNPMYNTFTVYFQPKSFKERCVLCFPTILNTLLYAFIFWQLALFLHAIQLGNSFITNNHKRLNYIGFVLITCQIVAFIFNFTLYNFTVAISYSSTNPEFHFPFSASGNPTGRASFEDLIAGCIFLVIARAFKKGYTIQKEQDLII